MSEYLSLSWSVQALLRIGFALCTLGMLALSAPNAHRFFGTAGRSGYADDEPWLRRLLSPLGRVMVLASWTAAACWLLVDRHTVMAALICLVWSRLFFIALRWKSLSRGMGAPGFMLYWLSALIFFLEWTRFYDPNGTLRPMAILVFKVDFAVIMLCAGQYKVFSGYPQNNGMERGMVNPWWGRLWRLYRRVPPGSPIFRTLNHLGYLGELVAGVLMLYPPTAEFGGLFLAASFVFIFVHIRLGFLCHTVFVSCFLFCAPGGWVDSLLPTATTLSSASQVPLIVSFVNGFLYAMLALYLVLLPFAKLGLYYNFYAKKRWPDAIQKFQDRWTTMWGLIIWRVFTIDNTNFFVNIYTEDPQTGRRTLYSKPGSFDLGTGWRFIHVCEFVCLVSIFTTIKYFPSNSPLFVNKLWRYARSVPRPEGHRLVFEWVDIKKTEERFEEVASREFLLDFETLEVTDTNLEDGSSQTDQLRFSQLVEGGQVGSYAPAKN